MIVFFQIIKNLILVSIVIVFAWMLDLILGRKIGYRWRKFLWLILAVWLLFPISPGFFLPFSSGQSARIVVEIPESLTVALRGAGRFSSAEQIASAQKKGDNLESDATSAEMETAVGIEMNADRADFQADLATDDTQGADLRMGSTDGEREDALITGAVSKASSDSSGVSSGTQSGIFRWIVEKALAFSVLQWIACIWVAGAICFLIFRCLQYRNVRNTYFLFSRPCTDADILFQEKRICTEYGISHELPVRIMANSEKSPLLMGYRQPTLYLPDISYTPQELEPVLRHELTHYRGKDLWYKLFFVIVCDIYWFYPVLRLMKRMAFRDVEYACDEKTTGQMDLSARKGYSNAILRTITGERREDMAFTTHFSGTKKDVRRRFENIFTKHSRFAGAGALVLSVTLLLTGTLGVSVTAQNNDPAEDAESVIAAEAVELSETTSKVADVAEKMETAVDSEVEEEIESTVDAVAAEETSGVADEAPAGQADTARILTISADLCWDDVPEDWITQYPNYEISTDDRYFQWTDEYLSDMPNAFSINAEQLMALADEGYLADITDLLEARGWLDMDDSLLTAISDENGRVFGIPIYTYTYGLAVNKDLFREAGLADENGEPILPATWEELANDASQISEKTDAAGLCLISDEVLGALHFYNLAWDFGAGDLATYQGEQNQYMGLDSDASIQAMELIKTLKWEENALTADPTKEDFNTGIEHLGNGTAAMYFMPSDMMQYLDAYGIDPDTIAFGALPAGPDGEKYAYFGGGALVFSADTQAEDIDAILSLIETQGTVPITGSADSEPENGIPTDKGKWKAASAHYQSELAQIVTDVLHKVVTDPDADVAALMQAAEKDWENINE